MVITRCILSYIICSFSIIGALAYIKAEYMDFLYILLILSTMLVIAINIWFLHQRKQKSPEILTAPIRQSSRQNRSKSTSTINDTDIWRHEHKSNIASSAPAPPSKPDTDLFEYDDISSADDTATLITLLRKLSSDMDCVLKPTVNRIDSIIATNQMDSDAGDISDSSSEDTQPSKISSDCTVDPNWETSICSKQRTSDTWGSYSQCSSQSIQLRGAEYLTDKIKTPSQESLLSLAHMDIFTTSHRIQHIAQNNTSWFYQNRQKLPRSLFFIIIHLRLDSISTSVVQYFYVDRDEYSHLLKAGKCSEMLKEKGDGYFAINGKGFDESGMFWNFINGSCQYRNDRLKLIARKAEGPWYLYIPSKPAIIGRKVPIKYYRGYDAKHLNSSKVHNSASDTYKTYDFKALCHDSDAKETSRDAPCVCGDCEWLNTEGEYTDYLEIDMSPEVNALARNIIRIACPLAKSLQIEMHWTLEGQTKVELPERMLCSAKLTHIDLQSVTAPTAE